MTLGNETSVGPAGKGDWRAVEHFHPNKQNAKQFRLPASADFKTVIDEYMRNDNRPVSEIVDSDIPGKGRSKVEFGLDPVADKDKPYFIKVAAPGEPEATLRFKSLDELETHKMEMGTICVPKNSPLFAQLMANGAGSDEKTMAGKRVKAVSAGKKTKQSIDVPESAGLKKEGGVIEVIPEGVNKKIYDAFLKRSDPAMTLDEFVEQKDVKRKVEGSKKSARTKGMVPADIPVPEEQAKRRDQMLDTIGMDKDDVPKMTWRPFSGRNAQGREEYQGALRVLAHDPDPLKIPPQVRADLQRQLKSFETFMKNGSYDETVHRLTLPDGYVLGHWEGGDATPAREGFDYTNARVITKEQNALEEKQRRAAGK